MSAITRIGGRQGGRPDALPRPGGRREVVAEILEDGTIRPRPTVGRPVATVDWREWGSGTVSGRGWMLWWERRRWEAEPASDRASVRPGV